MRFLKIGDAAKELGICKTTLRKWIDKDEIPHRTTPGGHRLVDVESYLEGKSKIGEKLKEVAKTSGCVSSDAKSSGKAAATAGSKPRGKAAMKAAAEAATEAEEESPENSILEEKAKIIYCRVFSKKQKEDLAEQIKKSTELYPDHLVISDTGSSSNVNRKGFQSILEKVCNREVEEVVVFHKDVLSRLDYDLIKSFFEHSKTHLKVHDRSDAYKSKDEEVTENILSATATLTGQKSGKKTYTFHNVTVNVAEEVAATI
jgi:excisionase family DNA binding protein